MYIKQERKETKIKNKGGRVGGNEEKEESREEKSKRTTNNKCDSLQRSKTTISTQSISQIYIY